MTYTSEPVSLNEIWISEWLLRVHWSGHTYDTVISLFMHTLIIIIYELCFSGKRQSQTHRLKELRIILSEGAALPNKYCILYCLSANLYIYSLKLSSGCIWVSQISAGYNRAAPALGPRLPPNHPHPQHPHCLRQSKGGHFSTGLSSHTTVHFMSSALIAP